MEVELGRSSEAIWSFPVAENRKGKKKLFKL
jgi:hypothetical protein